jgi:hypothetical protein
MGQALFIAAAEAPGSKSKFMHSQSSNSSKGEKGSADSCKLKGKTELLT